MNQGMIGKFLAEERKHAKYTQKQLKNLVLQGAAVDITHMSDKEIYAIKDSEKWLDEIRLGSRNLWL